ncbi:hypothetical protein [Vibrio cholerae]|uniref:hypothetical protein n=1 Tax=Vibrio cholerae TaxID=666 RepID=UPI003075B0C4
MVEILLGVVAIPLALATSIYTTRSYVKVLKTLNLCLVLISFCFITYIAGVFTAKFIDVDSVSEKLFLIGWCLFTFLVTLNLTMTLLKYKDSSA